LQSQKIQHHGNLADKTLFLVKHRFGHDIALAIMFPYSTTVCTKTGYLSFLENEIVERYSIVSQMTLYNE